MHRRKFAHGSDDGFFIAGRPGVVSVWHQDDGRWSGTGGWQQDEAPAGGADPQQADGRAGGPAGHGGDSVLQRHHGDGGGFCQRGTAVPEQGHRGHHGRQYRHHRDLPDAVGQTEFWRPVYRRRRDLPAGGQPVQLQAVWTDHDGAGHFVCGHGRHDRGHGTPAGVAGLPRYDGMGQEPICGRAGGRGRNGASAEQLGQRGHLAGTGSHGGDQPAGVAVYPLRPEHRNLRDRAAGQRGRQPHGQARSGGASAL